MQFLDTVKAPSLATVLLVAGLALSLVSCSDSAVGVGDYDAPLELTGVRWQSPDSAEAPEELNPGDRVVLEGRNMNAVARVLFNGVEVSFNPALASESYLIVTIPADLPFGEMDPESETFNTIRVENSASEAQLDFPVLPPPPELREMSNEHAFPGDEVTLYGQFLYLVESITFPDDVTIGAEEVEAAADGSAVTFTLPDGVNTDVNGNVSITTVAGSDDSDPAFLFHGYRGVLLDMLNSGDPAADPVHGGPQVEQWDWWAAMHPYSGDIYGESAQDFLEGAEGDFVIVQQGDARDEIGEDDNAWWGGYRSINLTNSEWVAPEHLDESPENFAVKFEMAIHGEWTTGTFQILLNETGYAARVEPWNNEEGASAPVSYEGWRTYTVPLSEFRAEGGSGSAASSLTSLLGSDGVAGYGEDGNAPAFRFINDTPGALPAGTAFAIDKVRVVRIAEAEE